MGKDQCSEAPREIWIDLVKIFACVLVVLGHFFQSMVKSNIVPYTEVYGWFNQTIYYFHVPLFFMCSGYLFQKFTVVRSARQWGNNLLKKFISLGVPYLIFSLATYLMKILFSGTVNQSVDGLFKTIVFKPLSPYWYLYALIFIFLITFTINNIREVVIFIAAAVLMKSISIVGGSSINAVAYILENEIWFVVGMVLCFCNMPSVIKNITKWSGLFIYAIFIVTSIFVYCYVDYNDAIAFGMGILGCISTLLVALSASNIRCLNMVIQILSKYTLPVFLMHTIFAAGFRGLLLKIGISNSIVHTVFGIFISFIGPIAAAAVMSKIKWLEFILYPNKFIGIGGRKNVKET